MFYFVVPFTPKLWGRFFIASERSDRSSPVCLLSLIHISEPTRPY